MDWKDIATQVAKIGLPILGSVLPIPGGEVLGAKLADCIGQKNATPEQILATLTGDATALEKAKEFELTNEKDMLQIRLQYLTDQRKSDSADIAAVNATMQSEAASDHWPTYSWRPFCGFVFGTVFFGVYFVLPLFHIPIPTIPSEAWAAIGAVLGVASFYRGKMQADPNIKTDNRG